MFLEPIILFASDTGERGRHSLLRAYGMARLLHGELRVLGAGPRSTAAEHRRWCDEGVPGGLGVEKMHWSERPLRRAVVELACEIAPILVVVPAGMNGRLVTSLACAARVPVLVARPPSDGETVLAASDLSQPRLPVLREAAGLARRLAAPVVLLHNLPPPRDGRETASSEAARAEASGLLSRVRDATIRLGVEGRAVLSRQPSAADAIVRAARHADIVVVGSYRRSWMPRLVARSVAATVVDRAGRSVLVTPFVDRAPTPFSGLGVLPSRT